MRSRPPRRCREGYAPRCWASGAARGRPSGLGGTGCARRSPCRSSRTADQGTMMTLFTEATPQPASTKTRLASFMELVATAQATAEARQELQQLAGEQATLREVATLVAQGAEPRAVFDAVCEATGHLTGAASVNLAQFTPTGAISRWQAGASAEPTSRPARACRSTGTRSAPSSSRRKHRAASTATKPCPGGSPPGYASSASDPRWVLRSVSTVASGAP